MQASRWQHSLDKQGRLKPFYLNEAVHLLEFCSGCGRLTVAAARNGFRVGPSIDKQQGIGHADDFTIDLTKAPVRRIVWAMVVVLSQSWIHVGFPCTFWVAIAHWTRTSDLGRNEGARLESLVAILIARQLVYYQASRGRHSSLENPVGSVLWHLS